MSNADWWAKQLGTQTPAPQPRSNNIPMPQSQQPMTPYTPPQQPTPTVKAQSAKQNQSCPNCGGNNYMSPMPNIALRCYDCGYPIEQAGSKFGSLAGAKVEGSVKQATGNDVTSNWNPQTIIGRVDG